MSADAIIGWPANAYVGQKVVCVDACRSLKNIRETYPVVGKIYTIREVWVGQKSDKVGFCLVEIVNPKMDFPEGFGECNFSWEYFKPLVTKSTTAQVEALKRLCQPEVVE